MKSNTKPRNLTVQVTVVAALILLVASATAIANYIVTSESKPRVSISVDAPLAPITPEPSTTPKVSVVPHEPIPQSTLATTDRSRDRESARLKENWSYQGTQPDGTSITLCLFGSWCFDASR